MTPRVTKEVHRLEGRVIYMVNVLQGLADSSLSKIERLKAHDKVEK